MLARAMPDSLILTLVTGETVSLEVEDGRAELARFLTSDHEYTREWIKIDDETLVRREAIVSARIGGRGRL
jgi:hypothetical protein